MGRITETVKVLLIINIIFFIGSQFVPNSYQLFALWFFKQENFEVWQVLTHMFMHGGLMHIVFNMYALWAFGGPIEQMLGQKKFIFFYFSAGLGAALLHTLVNYIEFQAIFDTLMNAGMSSEAIMQMVRTGEYNTAILDAVSKETLGEIYAVYNTPAVGASGAIYGILVAFGMLFPNVELFLLFVPVPIKAKYFIPGLILLDLFSGFTGYSLFGGGIAHFAHVGGALFGFIMMWYWKKNQFNQNRWD